MPIASVPFLIPALPEIFMACAAMALLMLGVWQKSGGEAGTVRRFHLASYLGVGALIFAILLVITVSVGRMTTFGGMFVIDHFTAFFKILTLIASGLSIVIAKSFMERQWAARIEFVVLILFAALGMMMMISANDLMSMYLGLELQSLSLYVLAAFVRDDARSAEAGLKYFVLGALATGMLLYGCSLIYGFTGTTNFDALAEFFRAEHGRQLLGITFGIVFILAGLAFKVSAVPFHMWTPDVYEGAPTPVAAFFSVGPKLAAMALFIRVMMGPFGDLAGQWSQIVVLISIASMVLGAFAAINQTNIKRMMAYSSIGHVGYALIGLAVGDEVGVRGVLIYLAIYLFMNMGAFACILCMRYGDQMAENINDLAGLSKSHPMMAAAFAVFMFSMAGIPPLAGFFGKFYIFLAAIEANMYALAIIGVLSSVVGAVYYLRIVKIMYFDELGGAFDKKLDSDITVVLLATSAIILFFIVYPAPILSSAASAAAVLF